MKSEMKVILCLTGMLLGLETGARLFETKLSKDVAHIRELPTEAKILNEAPAKTLKVLVLGNSLARCGIDLEMLKKGLEDKYQKPVAIAKMHPDGSRIEEWTYGYSRYFESTGAHPDLILTTTGLLHLSDRLQNITGMGAFFVSTHDTWEFCWNRLSGIEDIARFWGARLSALWAHRDRVEPLVFYKAIPGYTETAQEINRSVSLDRQDTSAAQPKGSCKVFQLFTGGLKSTQTTLVIASVPMPEPYQLPSEIQLAIQNSGAFFLDLGASMKLPKQRFPDDYHLDAEGAALFTQEILAKWPSLNL
jgi:hypothetical protein